MLDTLPTCLLQHIVAFGGENSYLFTGTVNKRIYCSHSLEMKKTSFESSTATYGRLEESLDNGFTLPPDTLNRLARHDRCDMVLHVLDEGIEWDPFCVEYTPLNNSKQFLKWLQNTDLFWMPENVYASSSQEGNLEFMKFMLDSRMGYPDERCFIIASENENREIVSWLNDLRMGTTYQMALAIRNDDVDNMKILWSMECPIDQHMVTDACVSGSCGALWFLVSKGFIPTHRDLKFADTLYRFEIVSEFHVFL